MNKKAFTLIELVFVIVIAGILMTIAIPRFKKNDLDKAAEQIASHIRYTQHLAMQDDKFDPNDPNWYKKRWGIFFTEANICGGKSIRYTVYADSSGNSTGNPNSINEVAPDPEDNSIRMTGGWSSGPGGVYCNEKYDLGKKFSVKDISFSGGCPSNTKTVLFDELGRPMKKNSNPNRRAYEDIMSDDCKIKIENSSGKQKLITIIKQTGYVVISDN